MCPYRFVTFPQWWNKTVIFDSRKNSFNRRELVLALSNTDGGAHVDPELDDAYFALTRENTVGWVVQSSSGVEPIQEVERYSLRQMAYEVSKSVDRLLKKHGQHKP